MRATAARLAERTPGLRLAVLFGSVARGQALPDSDADIALLGGDFWPALSAGAEIAAQLGREPHVVDLATANDALRFHVARDGILLFEYEALGWARFQAEAALRYFDIVPMIRQCAAGARARLAGRARVTELPLGKALACRERIEKIGRALPASPEAITEDGRLEAFVACNIFLLAQDAIDLATHLVAARGLAVPGSHREAFEALARHGLLSARTASAMAAMAALRNRIAHTCADLDPVGMVKEAPAGLATVSRFLDELAPVFTAEPPGGD
jgi:uncharacterized protein YutE (UPF0331/DUF86 family)/predicted nucleotidyltransferase